MPPQIENRKQKSKAEKSKPLAPQTRGSRVSKETKSTAKSKGSSESLHYNEGKIFSLSDSEGEEAANTRAKIGPGKVIYFWKPNEPNGFLGQWYPSVFKDEDGTEYTCAEQYMMYHKALILSAPDIAARIMATKNPSEMKHLGSVIKPYDEKLWASKRCAVVEQGNYFKFTQNPEFRRGLLSTERLELVEASPLDAIWGIGFAKKDAEDNRKGWGRNLLGEALMAVRERLRKE